MDARAFLTAKGWLTPAERWWLHDQAAALPPDAVILEIGGEYGASTVCLRAGNPTARIVTVDWFRNPTLDEHLACLARAGVTDTLQFRGDSRDVGPLWRCPLDFLFVDGGHEHETVWRDIVHFTPWVRQGRIVAFHDVHGDHPLHAEVRRAVDAWQRQQRSAWEPVPAPDTLCAFRRVAL